MVTTPRHRTWEFRRSRWWPAVAAIAVAFAGVFVWAYLRTIAGCAHPDCAETRFQVHVEIDSLRGVEDLPLEVDGPDGPVSARALLATGGIDVEITRDQTNLPYEPSAGALDQADLLAYLEAWSVRELRSGFDGQVYALAAPGLQSETGTPLFGVLFDLGGREAIAVAPRTTRRLFSRYAPDAVPLLQLRTLSHELLHAFNRHHVDAERAPDGRLTVEAPTRCISDVSDDGWRLNETPLMMMSSRTVQHFQQAPSVDVLPGAAMTAFDLGRGAARECDLARRTPMGRRRTPMTLLRQWFFGLTGISNAEAGDDARPTDTPGVGPQAELRLAAQTAAYPLGFPVTVRLQARNTGSAPLALIDRLSPEYTVVRIETRAEGSNEWRPVQPLFTLEPLGEESAMLEPGTATSQSIEIFYGETGWTFARPGRYEVRARMSLAKPDEEVRSEPVPIVISAPAVAADAAALQPLLDDAGRLDEEVGRYLAFHGRIRADATRRRVSTLIDEHPQTALGAALRLTAGAQALRAPIDPTTGRRAAADLATARGLLAGACRESGLMALGRRLLRTAEAGAAAADLDRAAAEADEVAAWEGTRPPGAAAPSRLRRPGTGAHGSDPLRESRHRARRGCESRRTTNRGDASRCRARRCARRRSHRRRWRLRSGRRHRPRARRERSA